MDGAEVPMSADSIDHAMKTTDQSRPNISSSSCRWETPVCVRSCFPFVNNAVLFIHSIKICNCRCSFQALNMSLRIKLIRRDLFDFIDEDFLTASFKPASNATPEFECRCRLALRHTDQSMIV